jgi:hypothetical protein
MCITYTSTDLHDINFSAITTKFCTVAMFVIINTYEIASRKICKYIYLLPVSVQNSTSLDPVAH